MSTVLFRGGRVHTPDDPAATALAVTDGIISWIGGEHSITAAGHVDTTVDLDGALVVPGFVDAHVHSTDAGLPLTGIDLTAATGRQHALALLAAAARDQPDGLLWAHGWDDTRWPAAGAEAGPPTGAEIDAVVGDRPAYVARIDLHSAVVSRTLLVSAGIAEGDHADGRVVADVHQRVRATAKGLLGADRRARAQQAFLRHAAAAGIVEVHEAAIGDPAGEADLAALLTTRDRPGAVRVRGYLAALVGDEDEARAVLARTGADALGGDLAVDGSLGSHTAALREPYRDASTSGRRYLTDEQIVAHLEACTRAGIQAGFHAIGDAAVGAVVDGLRRAAERLAGSGPAWRPRLAGLAHRIEHAEMVGRAEFTALGEFGLVASVQPRFDEAWGGPDGMYARRLGAARAGAMNSFADLAAAGVALAFGSDAPVTPVGPWKAMRAAVHPRTDGHGVSPRAALTAHTRGGHRAAGRRSGGQLTAGAPADLVVADSPALVRPAADPTVARWSTDPRSGVPLLPDLAPGARLPRTVATLVDGALAHSDGSLAGLEEAPLRGR
ncbi:amidohydrolase [Nakamurella leprariae]|uniref:Amidohydrolase family protein n=1 Tax=Nakamurella leprariae TaxID=2803911 RepID=A0A938YA72_9ACTN|nr:amidohydrolase family protein [Nakamurella leprariae]MBM9465898.1 amidohydrolase family protein [Nakamurella leprariae]